MRISARLVLIRRKQSKQKKPRLFRRYHIHDQYYRPARKLRFAPLAWLKWQYLCHAGPTEVAGFGLSAIHDPLYVEEILVIEQRATAVTVAFDDGVSLFDRMTDLEIAPHRFARVWLHSHPGASAAPSSVDEATFSRVFGVCDWSVMAILSRTSATSARLLAVQRRPGWLA